jgi:hypothetical protein
MFMFWLGCGSIAHLEIAMSNKRPGNEVNAKAAFTVQVDALGQTDFVLVQRAMEDIAPDWYVELQGICANEATVILVPDSGDDQMGPSFVISREAYGLRLDQVHWDEVTEVGIFASLNDVLAALRLRWTMYASDSAPASITLH